jgi:hypothetical protein
MTRRSGGAIDDWREQVTAGCVQWLNRRGRKMDRALLGYLMLFLLVLCIGAVIARLRYNSPDRRYQRRLIEEDAAHARRMAAHAPGERARP